MDTDQIIFKEHHVPSIRSGSYRVKVRQEVEADHRLLGSGFETTQRFDIAGDRCGINSLDVQAMFPPPGSTGDHSNCLPHISFKRASIPWEWHAIAFGQDDTVLTEAQERVPWMALIVLYQDDKLGGILTRSDLQIEFGDLSDTLWTALAAGGWIWPSKDATDTAIVVAPSTRKGPLDDSFLEMTSRIESFLDRHRSHGTLPLGKLASGNGLDTKLISWNKFNLKGFETAERPVAYIDLDTKLFTDIVPRYEELQYLAHVRQALHPGGIPAGEERAFVMSNRLPAPGESCTVHLVSFEGRWDTKGQFIYNLPSGQENSTTQFLVRLISLKSWQFHCIDSSKSLINSLLAVKKSASNAVLHSLQIAPPPNLQGDIASRNDYLARGSVPLPHFMRMGSRTVSWYRGPFTTAHTDEDIVQQRDRVRNALVENADQLLDFDTDLNMFDVSYAAAWELGRMLMLAEKDLAQALFSWKRSQKQQLHQAEEAIAFPHLPFMQQKQLPLDLPADLARWLDDLRLLKGVPFQYLVPDERLLPAESIRYFQVDELWVEALLDGAFSIGRVSYKEAYKPGKPLHPNVSGILLRSEVVPGWPDLTVDAYIQKPDPNNLDENLTDICLPRLRMDRVTNNILLCLFSGEIETVDIHLKPEGLHFGFNQPQTHPSDEVKKDYYKDLRDTDGTEAQDEDGKSLPVVIACRDNNRSTHVLDIAKLRSNFRQAAHGLGKGKLLESQKENPNFLNNWPDAGDFALQMIEGVPKVRFIRC